jgi:tetratricopeptide (TPR) repeat protein
MLKSLIFLNALFGLLGVAIGQSPWDKDPTPVFPPGYLDNNYRIVYLLENETIIAVERINEKETGKEFLQFESAGKNSFATLQMDVEGGHWVALKIRNRDLLKESDKEAAKKVYDKLISDQNGKKTILIDTKYTWCNEIHHRFANNTEIETRILGYSEEKGPNGERDYEKGIQVMTGNSPNFPARINVIPEFVNTFYISSEQTKNIHEKEIPKLEKSSNPYDLALIGMYYFSRKTPQLEEAHKYFNLAYELLPQDKKEIKDGLDSETFQILVGRNALNQKEKLKQPFAQDPISIIQKLLNREQQIKEDLAFLKEKQKAQDSNNLGTMRRVVPVPYTNKVGIPPMPTNEVVIRKRVIVPQD